MAGRRRMMPPMEPIISSKYQVQFVMCTKEVSKRLYCTS